MKILNISSEKMSYIEKYLLPIHNYLLEVFGHCPTIEIIYILILKIWKFFTFILIFHVTIVSSCILIEWHTPFLIPFSTINNISISDKISAFSFSFFFKVTCNDNSGGGERNFAGSSSYILRHIFLRFQKHQLTTMYCFENTNHDILLIFLFQNLTKSFCTHIICIKNLLFQVMFHSCFIPNVLFPIIHIFITINTFSQL